MNPRHLSDAQLKARHWQRQKEMYWTTLQYLLGLPLMVPVIIAQGVFQFFKDWKELRQQVGFGWLASIVVMILTTLFLVFLFLLFSAIFAWSWLMGLVALPWLTYQLVQGWLRHRKSRQDPPGPEA